MQCTDFDITGMSCAACSARVEKAAGAVQGVAQASVNLLKNQMRVHYSDAACDAAVIEAVQKAGYGARVRGAQSAAQVQAPVVDTSAAQAQALRRRLGWSAVFCAVLMYLSMAPMLGLPLPAVLAEPTFAPISVLTQLLLTLPVVVLNARYFKVGFGTLLRGSPNMDTLVAIGSSASVVFGIASLYAMLAAQAVSDTQAVVHYAHNLYFDSAAMILTLITVGKYAEARAKAKTTDAIGRLVSLVPETATVVRFGEQVQVSVDQVAVGETVIVRTGERIPVDGVLIEGDCEVDESAITGESVPVVKTVGAKLTGATLLVRGVAQLRAEHVGKDTTLAHIIALVDEATSSKAPVARLADRVSGIFVPVVIAIALVSGLLWWACGQSLEFAATIAVSVLVISCPCALGLATPTAIMVGTGKGAECGILMKSAEAIETTGKIDVVVFDKTGTITEGKPVVTDVMALGEWTQEQVVRLSAAVEDKSEHPLARAIVACAQASGIAIDAARDFAQSAGRVAASVGNHRVEIGNQALLNEECEQTLTQELHRLSDQGKTVLFVRVDDQLAGLIAVADAPKPESAATVAALREMGLRVLMLTGDNARTAQAVARAVGIDEVRSEVLPADKARVVQDLQQEGLRVMMVGDGINDAPALALADVGCAIGAGTDVALDCADIVLMHSRLSDALAAVQLSKAVMRNIAQNLFWAFFYNAVGITVAAGVLYPIWGITLNPMIAAAAMSLSSVSVVTNALRLRGFTPTQLQQSNTAFSTFSALVLSGTRADTTTDKGVNMQKIIHIEGMHCGHCTGAVYKKLSAIAGVEAVEVSLDDKCARVTCQDSVSDETLREAVTVLDFEVKGIETL